MDIAAADKVVMKNAVCCELFTELRHYGVPQPCKFRLSLDKNNRPVIELEGVLKSGFNKLGFYDANGKPHYYIMPEQVFNRWKRLLGKEVSLLTGDMWHNTDSPDVLKLRAFLLDAMVENSVHGICWRKKKLPMPVSVDELFIAWDLGTFKIHALSKNEMVNRLFIAA